MRSRIPNSQYKKLGFATDLKKTAESTEVQYACLLDPCNLIQVIEPFLAASSNFIRHFRNLSFTFCRWRECQRSNAKGGRRDVSEALLDCSAERLHFERAVQLNVREHEKFSLRTAQTRYRVSHLCRHSTCRVLVSVGGLYDVPATLSFS